MKLHQPFLMTRRALPEAGKLPTFTTARPRPQPGIRPAGLWQCTEHELARWKADDHRYPPYVYRDKHGLKNGAGALAIYARERGHHGFSAGLYCGMRHQRTAAGCDIRHSLVGNSWHVLVISWLMQQLFRPLGLTPVCELKDIRLAVTPGCERQLQGYLKLSEEVTFAAGGGRRASGGGSSSRKKVC